MEENQFDDTLKNKIRDHQSPVPDDMWDRIIQKKDKDRKGFLFFFRWFTILLLAICLGGYLLMNHTQQKSEPANHVLTNPVDSQQAKTGSLAQLNKEAVGKEENTPAVTEYLPKSNKGSYSSRPFPVRKKESYSSRPKRASKENEGNYKSVNDKKIVLATTAAGAQNSSSQRDSVAGGKDDSALNTTATVNNLPPVVKLAPDKTNTDSSQKAAVKKTQSDSGMDKKWYLDVYASPDWPMDHTSITSSSYISYTIGLRINRTFGKHFSGKIGIQYSKINFTYPDSLSYLNSKVSHLKSFDLPFLAGYSFGAEKLKMTITAGGIVNFYSFYTGDPSGDIFKTNTGFSLYLGFNLEKKVNQKISIYLEPYYRYRLTSMTISSVEFDKFIDVAGLSIGARYHFLKGTKK
jgi:hypothetical protein